MARQNKINVKIFTCNVSANIHRFSEHRSGIGGSGATVLRGPSLRLLYLVSEQWAWTWYSPRKKGASHSSSMHPHLWSAWTTRHRMGKAKAGYVHQTCQFCRSSNGWCKLCRFDGHMVWSLWILMKVFSNNKICILMYILFWFWQNFDQSFFFPLSFDFLSVKKSFVAMGFN